MLLDPDTRVVNDLLDVVGKYGTPEDINAKAAEAGKLENLLRRLDEEQSPYAADLSWLIEQRDRGAFVRVDDWQRGRRLPRRLRPIATIALP